MATATVSRFHPPKATLFPTFIKKQKTTSYPDANPRPSTTNLVRTLSWSPFGTHIATGMNQRSIKVWDAEKPRLYLTEFRAHIADQVLYNPTGAQEIVSMGVDDGAVRFWDVRSKSASGEVVVGKRGELERDILAWSPEGQELVVGKRTEDDGIDLIRIDCATRSVISTTRQPDTILSATFNNTGDALLTTTTTGHFKILEYPSLQELSAFPAHNSSCNALAYHPSGNYIATAASDGLISLYQTQGWLPKRTYDVQAGRVTSVSFSCDGTYLIGGSDEGKGFEIHSVETGEPVYRVVTREPAPVVKWSPGSYAIAWGPGEEVRGRGGVGGLRVLGAPTPS